MRLFGGPNHLEDHKMPENTDIVITNVEYEYDEAFLFSQTPAKMYVTNAKRSGYRRFTVEGVTFWTWQPNL